MMNVSDKIQKLSRRLIDAQGPIRILDSVRWSDDVRNDFLGNGGREMPKVDPAWYQTRALGFDPGSAEGAFNRLERDITRKHGVPRVPSRSGRR